MIENLESIEYNDNRKIIIKWKDYIGRCSHEKYAKA